MDPLTALTFWLLILSLVGSWLLFLTLLGGSLAYLVYQMLQEAQCQSGPILLTPPHEVPVDGD